MATTWIVDQAHSDVQFKIKHLVISTVTGSFKTFSGRLIQEWEDFEGAKVYFEIDPKSIDTNNTARDEHLRWDDFFGTQDYPLMTFYSTSFTKISKNEYELIGNFTMKGITKSLILKAEFWWITVSPYGVEKAGFEISGIIIRSDFNITFNSPLEKGGMMIGEDVKFIVNLQIDKQGI